MYRMLSEPASPFIASAATSSGRSQMPDKGPLIDDEDVVVLVRASATPHTAKAGEGADCDDDGQESIQLTDSPYPVKTGCSKAVDITEDDAS